MDDKTFIAAFVAKEMERINQSMKDMVNNPEPPSEEEKEAMIKDLETTLARLQSALSQISADMLEEDEESDVLPS